MQEVRKGSPLILHCFSYWSSDVQSLCFFVFLFFFFLFCLRLDERVGKLYLGWVELGGCSKGLVCSLWWIVSPDEAVKERVVET